MGRQGGYAFILKLMKEEHESQQRKLLMLNIMFYTTPFKMNKGGARVKSMLLYDAK